MSPARVNDLDGNLRRLGRSLYLTVYGVGPGRYQVTGGAQPHAVEQHEDGWRCDCEDHQYGGRVCKHILAVRRSLGDRKVIHGLRCLVPYPRDHRRAVVS